MARARSRVLLPRSPREWALRGGLAAVALSLGYVSTSETFAYAIAKSAAERAHALAPSDGRIAAQLAEQLLAGEADAAQRAHAVNVATRALIQEPLAVGALTVLGLDAQLKGNTARARRLMVHSDALSRRELGTRLWLIEDAVEREDISAALRHYDIALRTSRTAPRILFPVLSAAISDAAIARQLAGMLADRPPWREAFIAQLTTSGVAPSTVANFLRLLAEHHVVVPASANATVVNQLVEADLVDEAWSYYRRMRQGSVVRDQSRDPNFSAQIEAPTVFDWTPVTKGAGVTASIQHTNDGGIFDFAAPSTIGATVLEQRLLLSPGVYQINGVSSGIDQPPDARPYWQLVCTDGRDFGRVTLPNSVDQEARFFRKVHCR